MYHFNSLEDATSAFISACEAESDTQFAQSDICAEACSDANRRAWGMTDEQILEHLGQQAKRGRSTMYARLLVGRVFPPDRRNPALYWSIHEVCARLYSDDDPDLAYDWLDYAADHDLSVRRLRAEIAAANGQPPAKTRPVYVLDDVPVTVAHWDERQMTVAFDDGFTPPVDEDGEVVWPREGLRLLLTAIREEDPVVMPGAVLTHLTTTS